MSLHNIPTEILLIIFNYLDEYSLIQLACVCKRINLLLSEILDKKSNHLLVTNQVSEKFRERCRPLLSSYTSKFITNYNWMNGKCIENKIYEEPIDLSRDRLRPRSFTKFGLKLNQNWLVFFYSSDLYAYDRTEDVKKTVKRHKKNMIIQHCNSAICDIVSYNDLILSAHKDGSIKQWRIESINRNYFFKLLKRYDDEVRDQLIICISATPQYIASGSVVGDIEIQKNTYDEVVSTKENKIISSDCCFITSIAFDPTEKTLAAGINNYDDSSSYIIYDINESRLSEIYEAKSRCSQLMWEDPHTILVCCERFIKKMDLRTPNVVVRKWKLKMDVIYFCPNQLSCISSDNLYTIITGTYYNRVVLWDQRQTSHRKIYNMYDFEGRELDDWKIIRSVGFDSCHLYTASNDYLHELDFKGDLNF